MEKKENEEFINNLIEHIKQFGYWYDCVIRFRDKCWSDFEYGIYKESSTLIEEKDDVYVSLIGNSCNDDNEILIYLYERGGGLLYRDDGAPYICDLPCETKKYMQNHQNLYHIHNFAMADGHVALFALEKFLFRNGKIIVDWNADEGADDCIVIADINLESIKRRDTGYAAFKKAIGYRL